MRLIADVGCSTSQQTTYNRIGLRYLPHTTTRTQHSPSCTQQSFRDAAPYTTAMEGHGTLQQCTQQLYEARPPSAKHTAAIWQGRQPSAMHSAAIWDMATFNSTPSGYMTGTAALSNAHGSPQMVTTATEPLHTSSINRKKTEAAG